nr:TonB-dependent receptor [Pyrinomonadaceae bacterium]
LIGAGADGRNNTADDILSLTGETVTQVQNRVLGTASSAPLFTAVPGYGLVGLRGAIRFGESSEVFVDFENIADKNYRGISWGVDGAGRSVTLRYRYKF